MRTTSSGGWAVYERLLDEIPVAAVVRRCLVGRAWTLVETDTGLGVAMTHRDEVAPTRLVPPLAGRPLRDLAAAVRSWNVREAALGLAAINAHFNARARVEAQLGKPLVHPHDPTVFDVMAHEIEGRRVAVIGHFPGLEPLARTCQLSILERNPGPGDLPDFAAEYVLPQQEYVFITGTTLVNKTLPRLLELSAGAKVVLVGPSVPLASWWFERGITVLAGSVVTDPAGVWPATAEGSVRELWSAGAVTVQLRAEDLARAAVRS